MSGICNLNEWMEITAYDRIGTKQLIETYKLAASRPDFIVIDPMVTCLANVADLYNIPYMYFHTSGLPLTDSWDSFFVRKPAHIPHHLIRMLQQALDQILTC